MMTARIIRITTTIENVDMLSSNFECLFKQNHQKRKNNSKTKMHETFEISSCEKSKKQTFFLFIKYVLVNSDSLC